MGHSWGSEKQAPTTIHNNFYYNLDSTLDCRAIYAERLHEGELYQIRISVEEVYNMQAKLTISTIELGAETLQDLTREFFLMINEDSELEAELASAPIRSGEKGAGTEAGAIALKWVKKINVKKVVELLKAFFARSESLVIDFEDDSGKKAKITITRQDLKDTHIKAAMAELEGFFEPKP